MDALAGKLDDIDALWDSPQSFHDWRVAVKHIDKLNGSQRVVLMGHSLGANSCSLIASETKRDIDLIVSFDAGGWFTSKRSIGANVKHLINIHSTNWSNWLGHGKLKPNRKFKGKLQEYKTKASHVAVDNRPELHEIALAAVRGLSDA
jgi:predicted alpha/beta-fold hydrolase